MATTTDPVKTAASGDRPDSGTALCHPATGPDDTAATPRVVNDRAAQDQQTPPHSPTGDPASSPSERTGSLKAQHKDQKAKPKNKVDPPGGFDATPIPDAPQGYTVKFIFHHAQNLPVADFGTGSSDPFLTATLTTALRKRHREDPDLFFRTRTIRKSLEPDWEQEWIVANVPASGFKLKCRLYDEDWPDADDRLGNVTLIVDNVSESWKGIPQDEFDVKKRSGSKRAYLLSACTSLLIKDHSITPRLALSAVMLGPSDPPHGHMYTVGPTYYFKHFSPMIGRMMGVKVNRNAEDDLSISGSHHGSSEHRGRETEKYDFQATTIQLAGPVPPKLYHRFVEFRPVIGKLFKNKGVRGKILNRALHHQHRRLYSFRSDTEFGTFGPCTEEASLQFLRMVHFDQGGRVFTYVITLDGMMRFTETGKEFGIDLLSKHTMHSDAAVYIACSGEFMIRRLKKPDASEDPEPDQPTHPSQDLPDGPPHSPPPANPRHYQLIIDNESEFCISLSQGLESLCIRDDY